MTDFDELIGEEPAGAERERLRKVHELLIDAGPLPELTPELASSDTLDLNGGRVRRIASSRRTFVPTLAAAALIALAIGIGVRGGGKTETIPLRGTSAAPAAQGTLKVLPATGHTQMEIDVHGLASGRYFVYLVRKGRAWAECGSFRVTNPAVETKATMSSPYRLQPHDKWLVTRHVRGSDQSVTVMLPTTA